MSVEKRAVGLEQSLQLLSSRTEAEAERLRHEHAMGENRVLAALSKQAAMNQDQVRSGEGRGRGRGGGCAI